MRGKMNFSSRIQVINRQRIGELPFRQSNIDVDVIVLHHLKYPVGHQAIQ